jgi:pSer/pThr/pTyr-binding forkhead associated (FHA) protein
LGSRNGTLVNGRRLNRQQAPVQAGEVIQFGPVKATVEFEPPDERWRLLEGDTATDITAYYGYRRRQLRQAAPPPAPAALVLGGDATASGDEPTVPALVPPGEERPAMKPGPTLPLKPGRLTAWLRNLKHSVTRICAREFVRRRAG